MAASVTDRAASVAPLDEAAPARLYPKSRSAELDPELFRSPTSEYRGTPFWSWNNRLDADQLRRQIGYFQEMGFGGFHMHSRTGLATPYLSDEYMAIVRSCTEEAQRRGMLAWLYDEDRWPSGFAGGLVTEDPAFRQRHLLWTATPYGDEPPQSVNTSGASAARSVNGVLLGRYEVSLDEDGLLADYRRLAEGEEPSGGGVVWYAYVESALPVPWFNNQTYVDTLNPEAMRRFIELTHERYRETVGDYFGGVIPAIFTDEPQFVRKASLRRADEMRDLMLPWTGDFTETYAAAYAERIEEALPELVWELPGRAPSLPRYRYHDHLAERFASAFADQIGAWCERHGIALTGHMMEEPTLETQTHSTGEAMRSLRAFQLPGIDILCDRMELTTAKQAQSVAHQYGREGVASELYGVTNWDFDFVGHKAQGDWQAALGVTVRVPHLAWVSMAGEAKRDYPASISYQSPWFREYSLIEDHFARVAVALTRGRPLVKVGVIHPIESYWLAYGPHEQTQAERAERNGAFLDLCRWLLFGLIDFDYLAESLLPELCPEEGAGAPLQAGAMAYDAVIVPGLRTVRSTTLDRLERFADGGGQLVFVGEIPSLVDGRPSDRAARLAARAQSVPLSQTRILDAVAPQREVEVRHGGVRTSHVLHQIRQDGDRRFVFLCNTDRRKGLPGAEVRLKGRWRPLCLDTFTGERTPVAAEQRGSVTLVRWDFTPHGHLLLELEPGEAEPVRVAAAPVWEESGRLEGPVPVTLSEPNVLLLDQAQWRLDDGPWQAREEVLRIENHARAHWQLPPKEGNIAQPWTERETLDVRGHVSLRFHIRSEVAVEGASLALENPSAVEVRLDGRVVPIEDTGWWVDEAIRTVALPPFDAGEHELVLRVPFTRQTDLEWCYLLGDFGVRVAGSRAHLTEPVRELMYGDWVHQGLPFYAGNVTYHASVEGDGSPLAVAVPTFKAPLIGVSLDGERLGSIAFAPFEADLGRPTPGSHRLDLTVFGNRYNSFGQLHNTDRSLVWFGPPAWRTEGRRYAYEYQLKPMGILTAPLVLRGAPQDMA